MRIRRWYKVVLTIWLFGVAPFWWFAAEFNGNNIFEIPTLASPSEGAGWQITLAFQIFAISAAFAPAFLLPFGLSRLPKEKYPHAQD